MNKNLSLCLLLSMLLAACNTVEGLGKDLKQAGAEADKAANQAGEEIGKVFKSK